MNVIISNKNKEILSNLNVDVSKRLDGEYTADEIIQTFSNYYYNKMFLDITAINDYQNLGNLQKLAIGLNKDKMILLLNDDPIVNSGSYISKLISMGFYNFTTDINGLNYLYSNPNSYEDVAHLHQISGNVTQIDEKIITKQSRILGIKNVTDGAGASSLIYMMKKQLSQKYFVVAIEVDKKDFMFFQDQNMISTTSNNLGNEIIKYKDADVILVDLNNSKVGDICNDVLYLIEPSTVKLNKMILTNRNVFNELNGNKIILNKSLLDSKDISDFEFECGTKVYYNLPPLDDKKDNSEILLPFLSKLGFVQTVEVDNTSSGDDNKLFGLFKI